MTWKEKLLISAGIGVPSVFLLTALTAAIRFSESTPATCVYPLHAYVLGEFAILEIIGLYFFINKAKGHDITTAINDPKRRYFKDYLLVGFAFHSLTFIFPGGLVLTLMVHFNCGKSVPLWILIFYWFTAVASNLWSVFLIIVFIVGFFLAPEFGYKKLRHKWQQRKMIAELLSAVGTEDQSKTFSKIAGAVYYPRKYIPNLIFQYVSSTATSRVKIRSKNLGRMCFICKQAFKSGNKITDLKCCCDTVFHFSCLYRRCASNTSTPCCSKHVTIALLNLLNNQ